MIKNKLIVLKDKINQVKNDIADKKIAYFVAHTYWGKTSFIKQYMAELKLEYIYISATERGIMDSVRDAVQSGCENIVIDDMHRMKENGDILVDIIANSPANVKFFILSRSVIPSYLKVFYVTRTLVMYDNRFFAFDKAQTMELAKLLGVTLDISTVEQIDRNVMGYPLAIIASINRLQDGKYTASTYELASQDIYEYFDSTLFNSFSLPVQQFLLNIGHLSEFTKKQASIICGQSDIDYILDEILNIGSFLRFVPPNKYKIHFFFVNYITWKQSKMFKQEDINRRYENTALYFSLEGDVLNALKYYSMAKDNEKIIELLTLYITKYAGGDDIYDIGEYLLVLPKAMVNGSPELLAAISLLYSMNYNSDKSEKYYNKLLTLSTNLATSDSSYRRALYSIAYLDFCLLHRSAEYSMNKLLSIAQSVSHGELNPLNFGITGNMPSVVNGWRDIWEWIRISEDNGKSIYDALNIILDRQAVGLMDAATGEILAEKNYTDNFTEELMLLNSAYAEIQHTNNIQLKFAIQAILAQIYVAQGKHSGAVEIMEKMRLQAKDNVYVYRNIEAFLCNLALTRNDMEIVNKWFENDAPNELDKMRVTYRYRYITKLRVYVVKGMYSEALSLISKLEKNFTEYSRSYNYIDVLILKALILYRQGANWKDDFNKALEQCYKYSIIRIVSRYGIDMIDMLKGCGSTIPKDFMQKLISITRVQATLYPLNMATEKPYDFDLTSTERAILRLVADGLTNEEIGSVADLSLRTVKFHVSNILLKLCAKNRITAVRIAVEKKLI